jgi:hypothetical protein
MKLRRAVKNFSQRRSDHYGAPIEQPDCRLHGIGNAPMAWCTTLHALTKSEVRSEVPCNLASLASLNIRN